MSFSPYDLKYLIEISHTKNISRAAERIGIAQPSLSLALKRLEESCGIPLVIRNKNGIQMTKSGQKLVVKAKALLEDWDNIKKEVLNDQVEISGQYVIGCHASVALYSLGHVLPDLLKKYSQLDFKLTHDLSRNITSNVISFKNDFGIVINPTSHPDLVIKNLGRDEVTFWRGPQKNKLQNPKSKDAVLIADPSLMQTQALLKQAAKRKMNFTRIINSSNLEVIASLVASGSGVGVLPRRVATNIKSYKLSPLDTTLKYEDKICLIYRADVQQSVARKTIAKSICDSFK